MATIEHCLFCFETLAAELEDRTPMTLTQVQSSWASYKSHPALETSKREQPGPSPSITASQRLPDSRLSSSGDSTPASIASTNITTPASSTSSLPITESPLFVTWNTIHGSELHLRGCIGTFSPEPLQSGLSDFALTSALHDTRFSPISLRELPSLSVGVTLLTEFEPCAHPLDWDVGTHGIRLNFQAQGIRYSACYLPDVMVEQGWEQEEAVVSAMRKGGWTGKKSTWRQVEDLKVVRYKGDARRLDYKVFAEWREWITKESK